MSHTSTQVKQTISNFAEPRISVVIPTFHRNDLLARCLDCLAPTHQTLAATEYEVIVSDDGSKITAERLVREQYPWAQWVVGPQQGAAANRNSGAQYSRGVFIAFTDDDCLPDPHWLEAYVSALRIDISIYEGKTTCQQGIRSPLQTSPVNLTGGCLWSCNMLVSRKLFLELGGFDESLPRGEDIEFRERIKSKGYLFPFVADAIVDHPPRPQAWGSQLGALQESQVRLWYTTGDKDSIPGFMLKMIKTRIKELLNYPLSFGLLSWAVSSVVELTYITFRIHRWDRKHKRYYSAHKRNAE